MEERPRRQFSLAWLLLITAEFGVCFASARFGVAYRHLPSFAAGCFGIGAGIGGMIGFIALGRRGAVVGGFVGIVAAGVVGALFSAGFRSVDP